MFDMNPHAPYRFIVLIEHDWQASQEHLDEWEERYGHHPAVALALGKQHEAHGNPDKAEEYYAGYIAAVPDYEVYVRLARLYYRRGQKEKMLDVAEGLLEQEDYALNHASMSKLIAYTLMAEGAYDEALPWAERSAESYAAWGLQALADCYEGLGKLEEAHELYQAIDERYGSAMQYEFAARTGHGELDEAWTKKLENLRRYYAADGPEVQMYEAFQRALEGELAEAARKWQAVVETSGDPALALLAAALAVRSSEEEVAKSMLEKIAASEQAAKLEGAPLKELSELLLDVLASEEQTAPPVAKLVRLPASGGAANSHFAVAAFLEAKGNEQRAAEHYREAARWPAREGFSVILSWIRLRELGEDPLKLAPRYAGIEAGIQ
jgi:tetratricopeptide (TPR) repeat protein